MANPSWRVGISQTGYSMAYWYDPDTKKASNLSNIGVDPKGNVGIQKHEMVICVAKDDLLVDESKFLMVADAHPDLQKRLHQLWSAGAVGILPPSGEDIRNFGTPKGGGGKGPRR